MTTNPQAVSQFVVLRHQVGSCPTRDGVTVDSVHYDWMFLVDGALRTWSTDPIDSLMQDASISATKLPAHRAAYLEIQGDIGDNRGVVSQVARGTYEIVQASEKMFRCRVLWKEPADQGGHDKQQSLGFYRLGFYRSGRIDLPDEWELCLGRNDTNR